MEASNICGICIYGGKHARGEAGEAGTQTIERGRGRMSERV